jgi:hypothetical protein
MTISQAQTAIGTADTVIAQSVDAYDSVLNQYGQTVQGQPSCTSEDSRRTKVR